MIFAWCALAMLCFVRGFQTHGDLGMIYAVMGWIALLAGCSYELVIRQIKKQ